jgi:hypothetical protein
VAAAGEIALVEEVEAGPAALVEAVAAGEAAGSAASGGEERMHNEKWETDNRQPGIEEQA